MWVHPPSSFLSLRTTAPSAFCDFVASPQGSDLNLALNKDLNTSGCDVWMVITLSTSYMTNLLFLRSWKQWAGIYGRRHLHVPGSLPLSTILERLLPEQLRTSVLCKGRKPSSFLSKTQGWKPKVWHLCLTQLPPLLYENLSASLGNPHCTLLFGGYCRKLTSATKTGRRKIFVHKEYQKYFPKHFISLMSFISHSFLKNSLKK